MKQIFSRPTIICSTRVNQTFLTVSKTHQELFGHDTHREPAFRILSWKNIQRSIPIIHSKPLAFYPPQEFSLFLVSLLKRNRIRYFIEKRLASIFFCSSLDLYYFSNLRIDNSVEFHFTLRWTSRREILFDNSILCNYVLALKIRRKV